MWIGHCNLCMESHLKYTYRYKFALKINKKSRFFSIWCFCWCKPDCRSLETSNLKVGELKVSFVNYIVLRQRNEDIFLIVNLINLVNLACMVYIWDYLKLCWHSILSCILFVFKHFCGNLFFSNQLFIWIVVNRIEYKNMKVIN